MSFLLSPKEASAFLGISKSTLYRVRNQPDFPQALQVSMGRVAYRREDLKKWANELPVSGEKSDSRIMDNEETEE